MDYDKNSMVLWWPKIKGLGIPVPKTTIIRMPRAFLKQASIEKYMPLIKKTAKQLGYPLFIRTDLASGKHSWEKSCYVPNPKVLLDHMLEVISFNECADLVGLLWQAIVLREFIELDWKFTTFTGKMPVAKERRYFVKDGTVQCHHPYWLQDAIEQHLKFCRDFDRWAKKADAKRTRTREEIPEHWKRMLAGLNKETPHEIKLLTGYAEKVAKAMDGEYWSVDFAHAKNGVWYLIDMGTGENSFHHPDCSYCPEPMQIKFTKNGPK